MARIIIFGLAGAGKDTVSDMIRDKLAAKDLVVVQDRFARLLKETALAVFGSDFDERDVKEVGTIVSTLSLQIACDKMFLKLWPDDVVMRTQATVKLLAVLMPYSTGINFYGLSPRKFQQLLGTEVVRSVDANAWANETKARTTGKTYYVVSDGRFKNELLEPTDKLVYVFRSKKEEELKDLAGHASEEFNLELYQKAVCLDTSTKLEYNGAEFFIIDNLTDFEELALNVDDFLETL